MGECQFNEDIRHPVSNFKMLGMETRMSSSGKTTPKIFKRPRTLLGSSLPSGLIKDPLIASFRLLSNTVL